MIQVADGWFAKSPSAAGIGRDTELPVYDRLLVGYHMCATLHACGAEPVLGAETVLVAATRPAGRQNSLQPESRSQYMQ